MMHKIVKSDALKSLGIMSIAGSYCVLVKEVNVAKRNWGYWVKLMEGPYKGHREWFIPIKSIEEVE